ncbi:MAG: hypothetical protein DHS20C10_10690 [marine bacterium B5-7]|nr:MAG: hypothetical protein DHS20C10_10690 [marine bacterium B5-7]
MPTSSINDLPLELTTHIIRWVVHETEPEELFNKMFILGQLLAASRGDTKIIRLLLENPEAKAACLSDKGLRNNEGNSPLHEAYEHSDSIRLLLEDPDAKAACLGKGLMDNKGFTAFYNPFVHGKTDVVDLLLAEPEVCNAILLAANQEDNKPADFNFRPGIKTRLEESLQQSRTTSYAK